MKFKFKRRDKVRITICERNDSREGDMFLFSKQDISKWPTEGGHKIQPELEVIGGEIRIAYFREPVDEA